MTTRICVPVRWGERGHDNMDPETPCWPPELMVAELMNEALRLEPGAAVTTLGTTRPLRTAGGTTVLVERELGAFRLVHAASWLRLIIEPGTPIREAVAAVSAMPAKVAEVEVAGVVYSCGRADRGKMIWRLEHDGILDRGAGR